MAKTEVPTDRASGNRLHFVDSLRGIAALAVVAFHYYGNPELHDQLSVITPKPLGILLGHGWLGVQVFFVLSGFVIAYSLRNSPVDVPTLGNFTVRRWLRLSPPYYATFGVVLMLDLSSNVLFPERVAGLPNANTILAHFFYMQHVFGFGSIVGVFWTLCIEMQLYFAFVLLLGFARKTAPGAANSWWSGPDLSFILFALLNLLSLAEASGVTSFASTNSFVPYWYMFFGGVLTCRVIEGKIPVGILWAQLALVAMAAMGKPGIQAVVAGLVMLALYTFAKNPKLASPLAAWWLLYPGTISYSLYLVHPVVGRYCTHLGMRMIGSSSPETAASLMLVLASILLSFGAAHLLYILVERPSLKLSGRFKIASAKPRPLDVLTSERLCVTQS